MLNVILGVLAFVFAAASDFLETRYVLAVQRAEGGETRAAHRAAMCSVGMFMVGALGLIALVEVGWWLLIPEGFGLYAGSRLALWRHGRGK